MREMECLSPSHEVVTCVVEHLVKLPPFSLRVQLDKELTLKYIVLGSHRAVEREAMPLSRREVSFALVEADVRNQVRRDVLIRHASVLTFLPKWTSFWRLNRPLPPFFE